MTRVFFRLYTVPADPKEANAFCVGNEMGGLSERLVSFSIQESTTWKDLRQKLEFEEHKGICRRTAFNLELRHTMSTSSNPRGYKEEDLFKHNFATTKIGGFEGNNDDVSPALIPEEVETEPIIEIVVKPGYSFSPFVAHTSS